MILDVRLPSVLCCCMFRSGSLELKAFVIEDDEAPGAGGAVAMAHEPSRYMLIARSMLFPDTSRSLSNVAGATLSPTKLSKVRLSNPAEASGPVPLMPLWRLRSVWLELGSSSVSCGVVLAVENASTSLSGDVVEEEVRSGSGESSTKKRLFFAGRWSASRPSIMGLVAVDTVGSAIKSFREKYRGRKITWRRDASTSLLRTFAAN